MRVYSTPAPGLEGGLAKLRELAPAGFALGLHVRFAAAHIMVQTYPREWIDLYTSNGYLLCDPMVFWAFGNSGACRWSELLYPDPHRIMEQAAAHGLRYGVAVSHGAVASRSFGGFARSDREFTDGEIALVEATVAELHDRATPPKGLTDAQRQALRLIATGHRHAEAAAHLGISESALKARLKSARDRLVARTTAEAIQRAQEHNLL